MSYALSAREIKTTQTLRVLSNKSGMHLILAAVAILSAWTYSAKSASAFQDAVAPMAMPAMVPGPNGQMIAIDPSTGQPVPGQPGMPGGPEANPGGKKPGEKGADGKKDAKSGEGGEMKIITRSSRQGEKGDKDELKKAKADEKGKYRFIFRGQTWPDVLEWFAGESNKNLDWKSLPPDYLNLNVMKQEPSIDELRNILNRHLFMQGYTMFEIDGTLMVVELKSLNPAIVPRVAPEQLKDMPPFSVVKVTIPVPNMIAEEAIKELKPLLSSFNQMSAMKTTNRIEVIDTVVTLRELLTFINKEQVKEVREVKFREFVLKYGVAIQVRERLMALLGMEDRNRRSSSGGGGGGGRGGDYMQMQYEMQQQMQQQMQQMQQQQGGGGGKPGTPKLEIYFVADERRNSIYVHAPVDRMPEIEKLIEMIDAPSEKGDKFLANENGMQTYTLSGADPDTLIKSINDLCVLEPQTKLYVLDKKSRTFVAYASIQDHMTIRALVKKLDTTGRKPYVIYLKRLPAEVVAVSIDFLMNGEKEKKNNNRSYMYDFYGGYGSSRSDESTSNDKFRVVPDIEHNRLLLRANPTEYEEIQELLAKLGEIPDPSNSMNKQRAINLPEGMNREEFMRKLKVLWPQIAPNKLQVPEIPSTDADKGNSEPAAPLDATKTDQKTKSAQPHTTETRNVQPMKREAGATDKTTKIEQNRARSLKSATFAVFENKAAESEAKTDVKLQSEQLENATKKNPAKETVKRTESAQNDAPISPEELLKKLQEMKPREVPPVNLAWGIDGQLIISSDDPEALNQLEELLGKLTPQVPEYHKIELSPNASALWVRKNLEAYFKEEEKNDRNNRTFFYGDYIDTKGDDPLGKITKRRPLKFIDDYDTNTIIVVGANARQWEVIQDLVKIYDKVTPPDPQAGRRTVPVTLRYNKAKIVAEAVKEVYRELLSSKDRAMQNPNNDKKAPAAGTTILFGDTGGGEGSSEKRTQVTFNGRLSIGIDEHSNTLLVSTDGVSLMRNVMELINALDEAAKPSRTQLKVVQLGAGMTDTISRKALAKALQERLNPQQNQQQQNQNQQNNPQNQNQNPNNGGQVVAPEGGE